MEPGYRKNTKFIISDRSSTGFINKNEALDLILQHANSDEFYEIEPAIVKKVYLDPESDGFPTISKGNNIIPNLKLLGSIRVSLLHSQSGGETLNEYIRPISPHIVQYPLKGEIVNVANYGGNLYYYNPLNLKSKVNMNRIDGLAGEGKVFPELTKYNRPVLSEQGDTLIQGRFGQSLHFGSDINFTKPFLKLTVGQGRNEALVNAKADDINYPHITEINSDEASIHITTNEHIPLKTAAKSKMKTAKLGGAQHSVIAMNSDSIAINAKDGHIHSHAKQNINIAAGSSINLETEFGEIKLGDVDTNNPVVKGHELRDFLTDFVGAIENYVDAMKVAEKPDDKILASDNLLQDISDLKDDLGQSAIFFSKKVFVMNDHNPPNINAEGTDNAISNGGGDDLDLESMWDDVSWNEIQNVETEEYEVEKITPTAGVRG
tara:strand:+ start:81 stop:1382 length:1302 start_codon:yes stop_codon:yes gene_type:complete